MKLNQLHTGTFHTFETDKGETILRITAADDTSGYYRWVLEGWVMPNQTFKELDVAFEQWQKEQQ